VHFPGIKKELLSEALKIFYEVRDLPGLKKKPSTSELLDWLKLLVAEDIPPEALREPRTTRSRSRRCTARCSRTSRTSTSSSA
jgi:MoxR-like ATPase